MQIYDSFEILCAKGAYQDLFEENDVKPLNLTLRKYKEEYACSKKVCGFIEKKYNYEVNEDEVLYLTVHLVQIMNRKQQV